MVFNEILIPQDSFMETNVTRKRVRCWKIFNYYQNTIIKILGKDFFKENILTKTRHLFI